jgi:hypothetical protein
MRTDVVIEVLEVRTITPADVIGDDRSASPDEVEVELELPTEQPTVVSPVA